MDSIKKIEALYELRRYEDIIPLCMEELYKQESDKQGLYYYLIISFIHNKESKNALEFCIKAKKEFPSDATFIYLHSKISLLHKETKEATTLIKEALQSEPNNALYYHHYTQILLEEKKYVKAKEMIDKALELDSLDLDYHLSNALVIYMLDGQKIAREIVEEILQKEPHHENALYLKQSLFTSKTKEKKSILKSLLQKDPFDKNYQSDMKFIKFYYRYIPYLMLLSATLSLLLHSNRVDYGFLESFSILLFFIVGVIGSQDWRFNIPFIATLLGINAYYANTPKGVEFSDIAAILFLAPLLSYIFYVLFFLFQNTISNIKKVKTRWMKK